MKYLLILIKVWKFKDNIWFVFVKYRNFCLFKGSWNRERIVIEIVFINVGFGIFIGFDINFEFNGGERRVFFVRD